MKFQKSNTRNIALLKAKETKCALRLVNEGAFTDDLSTPLVQLVAQNAEELAFVLYASALPGVHQDSIFYSAGAESKTVNVHGLTLWQSNGNEELNSTEEWPATETVRRPFEYIPAPKIDREVVSILGRLKSLLTQTSDSPQPSLNLTDAALFLEVYISNFIEGGCVQLDEARGVLKGEAPCNSLAMLDVLRLKEVIAKDLNAPPVWRSQSDWMDWMRSTRQDFLRIEKTKTQVDLNA